ncbi:hypothetical protein NUM_58740 [Actinocatenispora comari]|uniref:AAA+ ATPase domain-containing protein n=1 Tax=Actinocatenispora comari TaxID=2807577 RepID=A0A8J4AJG5_9ACTN|nr:hypothetical protein NUM_58740 [Actinocatenispora comari]
MTTQRDSGVAPAGGRQFTEAGRQPDEPGDNRPTDTTEPSGSTHRPYPPEPTRAERREPTEHHAPPAAPDDLGNQVLGEALQQLRTAVAGVRFSLATAGAAEARQLARRLAGTLDDYLSPRLAELAGPLLVVVCGPTGAGKSTLVNSLVRAPVSQAGVLRPTTRAPVLVANPADASWFGRPRLLATFARTGGTPPQGRHLQVVAAPALPPGLALLDAPDIDSVAADNRELADELMSAADAWLFVTTANRYADETPWQLLRTARDRDAGLAVVLDRMPVGEARRIRSHLSRLLAEDGLADVPVFELAESAMGHERLLPEEQVAALRDWLERLAADGAARAAVARQTLDGAIGTLPAKLAVLTTELAAQHRESDTLRAEVRIAHAHVLSTVDDAIRDGGLLGGELAARWQELVVGGELVRAVQSRSGRLRDQLLVSLTGRALPGRQFVPAAKAALHSLVDETLADAARRIADGWRRGPAGTALLSDVDSYTPPDLVARWFDDLDEWIRTDDGQRSVARQTEYTIAAVRLLVLVAVLIAPARTDATGSERAMLDTVLADPVVRRISGTARDELIGRLRELADQQRRRYDAALNRVAVDDAAMVALSTAAEALVPARTAAALVTERRSLPPATPPAPPAPAPTTGALPGPDSPLFHPAPEPTGTEPTRPAGIDATAPATPEPGGTEATGADVAAAVDESGPVHATASADEVGPAHPAASADDVGPAHPAASDDEGGAAHPAASAEEGGPAHPAASDDEGGAAHPAASADDGGAAAPTDADEAGPASDATADVPGGADPTAGAADTTGTASLDTSPEQRSSGTDETTASDDTDETPQSDENRGTDEASDAADGGADTMAPSHEDGADVAAAVDEGAPLHAATSVDEGLPAAPADEHGPAAPADEGGPAAPADAGDAPRAAAPADEGGAVDVAMPDAGAGGSSADTASTVRIEQVDAAETAVSVAHSEPGDAAPTRPTEPTDPPTTPTEANDAGEPAVASTKVRGTGTSGSDGGGATTAEDVTPERPSGAADAFGEHEPPVPSGSPTPEAPAANGQPASSGRSNRTASADTSTVSEARAAAETAVAGSGVADGAVTRPEAVPDAGEPGPSHTTPGDTTSERNPSEGVRRRAVRQATDTTSSEDDREQGRDETEPADDAPEAGGESADPRALRDSTEPTHDTPAPDTREPTDDMATPGTAEPSDGATSDGATGPVGGTAPPDGTEPTDDTATPGATEPTDDTGASDQTTVDHQAERDTAEPTGDATGDGRTEVDGTAPPDAPQPTDDTATDRQATADHQAEHDTAEPTGDGTGVDGIGPAEPTGGVAAGAAEPTGGVAAGAAEPTSGAAADGRTDVDDRADRDAAEAADPVDGIAVPDAFGPSGDATSDDGPGGDGIGAVDGGVPPGAAGPADTTSGGTERTGAETAPDTGEATGGAPAAGGEAGDDAAGTGGTGAAHGVAGASDGAAATAERPATDDGTATGGGRTAEDGRTGRAGVASETTDGTGQEDT